MDNVTCIDVKKSAEHESQYGVDITMSGNVKFHTISELIRARYDVIEENIVLEFDVQTCKIERLEADEQEKATPSFDEIDIDKISKALAESLKRATANML